MENLTIKINGVDREVSFKEVYTRKIDRQFNEILFKNVNASLLENWTKDLTLNPFDIQLAQDYLISALTDLKPEEVDELSIEDYQTILEKVSAIKTPPKESQAS